jgi:hypothetical protein
LKQSTQKYIYMLKRINWKQLSRKNIFDEETMPFMMMSKIGMKSKKSKKWKKKSDR